MSNARRAALLSMLAALILSLSGDVSARGREISLRASASAKPAVIKPAAPQIAIVIPSNPVVVAPGQPAVGSQEAATPGSAGVKTASPTAGIINALCKVTLNIVGCGFDPDTVTLSCDTNSDGLPDSTIKLQDVTVVSHNLVQAVLVPVSDQLPGTAFPLSCCGGIATLTLSRTFNAADDNIFGPFTQTTSIKIDLGLRAPVVVSASPAAGDCSLPQDLVIPGACFLGADGLSNITSVFAVDRANPNNVVQATRFVVLNSNLIDALFNFSGANAGKTFLIFVSGRNGTSRNLTSLPNGASTGCPIGNEQGIQVTFSCRSNTPAAQDVAVIQSCSLDRTDAGSVVLNIAGLNIKPDAVVTINGLTVKKVKFKQLDASTSTYRALQVKGGLCGMLPGLVVVTNPGMPGSAPFSLAVTCD
ncbi:MAG: hypothetical protein DMF61_09475 [Blastocatellia bacterium AA13]|nr:MAG: hypothetical protein DMF61_09475 [Blastocatellia bacterium AA13]